MGGNRIFTSQRLKGSSILMLTTQFSSRVGVLNHSNIKSYSSNSTPDLLIMVEHLSSEIAPDPPKKVINLALYQYLYHLRVNCFVWFSLTKKDKNKSK